MKLDNLGQRNESLRLYQIYTETFEDWDGSDEGKRKMHAAYDAYLEYADTNGVMLLTDNEGEPQKCAIKGIPLIESDEVEIVLRSALDRGPLLELMEAI